MTDYWEARMAMFRADAEQQMRFHAERRAALAQPEPPCVACEGIPSPGNSPCHICGRTAQPEPQGPTMADLSPAALAVWEAFNQDEAGVFVDYGDCLAAALRAAADQVAPEEPRPTGMRPCGDTYSAREIRRAERMKLREQFLTITAELEAQ